jgi:hypothetical protein
MISHSGRSGAMMGIPVPHPVSSISASAAAWQGFIFFSVTLKRSGRVPNPDPDSTATASFSAKGPSAFRMTGGQEAEQKSRVRILNRARSATS